MQPLQASLFSLPNGSTIYLPVCDEEMGPCLSKYKGLSLPGGCCAFAQGLPLWEALYLPVRLEGDSDIGLDLSK